MTLRREVSEALEKRGYIREGRMHLKPLADGVSWVVDTGPLERAENDISPFVGIRHEGLEELVCTLLGVPLTTTAASVGNNVGFLLNGGYRRWRGGKADDVLSAIDLAQERLLPYLSLENIMGVWNITSKIADPAWRYREIARLLLLGQTAEIPALLEAASADFCRYEDEVCEQFRDFERRVQQHLSGDRRSW